MATDDHDTDDENEERTGSDAGRSPESPGTYANAGRERGPGEQGTETRRQAWDTLGTSEDTVPENSAPPDRHYEGRNEAERPSRRYGSRPPSGSGERTEERPLGGRPRGRGRAESPPAGGRPHDEGRVRDHSESGGRDPTESGGRIWVEKPGRTEQMPPKRTRPLREPTETSDASHRQSESRSDRGPETTDRGPEMDSRELAVSGPEPDSEPESAEESAVPKYGGTRDSGRERSRGQSVDRQRTQREHEHRFDREQARQRDFKRDKSGGKYRRR